MISQSEFPLNKIVLRISNGTTAKQNTEGRGYKVSRIETISDGDINPDRVRYVQLSDDGLKKWRIKLGDILVSHINSVDHIGKSAIFNGNPETLIHGMNLLLLRPDITRVYPEYLAHFLKTDSARNFIRSRCKRAINQASINQRELGALSVPLPSLNEQRRIVGILNRAAKIERLRAQAQERLREFIPALFVRMFGDQDEIDTKFPCMPRREAAAIQSGATKGRKIGPGDSVEVPYLRVANVQDGFLNLDEVKTIAIRRGEEEKYALAPGDLIMTEGGDPDKLGRAAIWGGELSYCAHQNHVFRVRANREVVLTDYLRDVAGSAYGKAYFLSVAKRTTGIASINKTQLGNLPVPVPPLDRQVLYAKFVAKARRLLDISKTADARATVLSASLMSRLLGSRT